MACVASGVRERPPVLDEYYSAFVDPSGGSADAMTLAIGHRQDEVVVIDALRERRPPFSPDDVAAEFAALLKSYRVYDGSRRPVCGRMASGAVSRRATSVTSLPRSRRAILYRDLLPLINARQIDLIDDKRLVAQLVRA